MFSSQLEKARLMTRLCFLVMTTIWVCSPVNSQSPLTEKPPSFERDVLPILRMHCHKCHGADVRKSGLDLRTAPALLRGGSEGPAIVKGTAEKSLLFQQISKHIMPPGKAAKLTDVQISIVRNWINTGASAEKSEESESEVTEKDRGFWAFRPPVRPAVPAVRNHSRLRTPIDAFVLGRLEAKGLGLAPEAERSTVMRRVCLDLLGLPPSPAEIEAFLDDPRPDAYERLVERLLQSPGYGERWGRHWLDAAGYADTVGGDNDPGQVFTREGLWRYRDYVIQSFNSDKPFDRFITEQLAGDELDDWVRGPKATPQMLEHLIATGFLRTSIDHTTEDELNRPFERYQVLHDTIENITSNLLGLTVACARCHDHKYDPISQRDYYRLLSCLKPVYNPEAWIQPQHRHHTGMTESEKQNAQRHNAEIDRQAAELAARQATVRRTIEIKLYQARFATIPEVLRGDLKTALGTEAGKRSEVQNYLVSKLGPLVKVSQEAVLQAMTPDERSRDRELADRLNAISARRISFAKIQAAWEPVGQALPTTHVFRRGNHLTPGQTVEPGYLAVLTESAKPLHTPAAGTSAGSSNRRLAWARWLTRLDHPLTARVFVNRVWQHHFGEGLVATGDNFGQLGARPTNPELLDWLATEFVRNGWQIKALHRLIVTSSVYRQASQRAKDSTPSADPELIDPGNQLLWRFRLRRVESEVVRDSILSASGQLVTTMGGPPVPIEPQTDGRVVVHEKALATPAAKYRRSLYLFTRRNYNLSLLSVFDQPAMSTNCTRRISSVVPLQSLTMLNDGFVMEQAAFMAGRVEELAGSDTGRQIHTAFMLAFARPPTAAELAGSKRLLNRLAAIHQSEQNSPTSPGRQALARLCHMLLCANEFIYFS